jgi:hypothetical protein
VFSSGLLVIHDACTRSQDHITNTPRGQKLVDPLLQIQKTDIESGGNNSAFVQSSVKLNDYFPRTVVVNLLELADIAYVSAPCSKDCLEDVNDLFH